MARRDVPTVLVLLVCLLPFAQLVEEKYHQNILERSEEIIKAQDAEEPLYKKDISKLTDTWKCDAPKPPDHGFIDGTDFSLGATVHVRCDNGYYLVGASVITCLAVPDPFHKQVQWDPIGQRECQPRKRMESENELQYKFIPEQAVALDDYEPKYGQLGSGPYSDTKVTPGPEGLDERCTLPKIVGTCRAAFPRYYFNVETMECGRFIYGGCDGNSNNFKTFEECQRYCSVNNA
ncbi:uncharacterized protein [Haliotis cracherodii]|uniref:uncharacterized protein isoform X1 n=1 Tax=Haliotis cracherodii TaxID=6455 RepID=UPI0039E82DB0